MKPENPITTAKNKFLKSTQRRGSGRTLLLSDYKPEEFGNAKIDLTVDGGQHLRSPGDEEAPKITSKNVQSIFRDPIFDHKEHLVKINSENRSKLLDKL